MEHTTNYKPTGKWLITTDVLEGHDRIVQSRDWKDEGQELFKFRLLDGDGVVYYEGVSDDSNSENAFRPLDDFGAPNDGCTSIEYRRNGVWVAL